ncbi:hypothetical protein KIPB_009575, partial [Kipferlia bialata]|eukprot:g9575.t1
MRLSVGVIKQLIAVDQALGRGNYDLELATPEGDSLKDPRQLVPTESVLVVRRVPAPAPAIELPQDDIMTLDPGFAVDTEDDTELVPKANDTTMAKMLFETALQQLQATGVRAVTGLTIAAGERTQHALNRNQGTQQQAIGVPRSKLQIVNQADGDVNMEAAEYLNEQGQAVKVLADNEGFARQTNLMRMAL